MNYNLYLSSIDKVGGTNNNATFQVNWSDFLPADYTRYSMNFALTCDEDYYMDTALNYFNNVKVTLDTSNRTYSYDTATKAQSSTIGYMNRTVGNPFCYYASVPSFNVEKVIERPSINIITMSFINTHTNTLLVRTDNAGVLQGDMSNWIAVISFTPVESSKIVLK